jgi:hypothetical protein
MLGGKCDKYWEHYHTKEAIQITVLTVQTVNFKFTNAIVCIADPF